MCPISYSSPQMTSSPMPESITKMFKKLLLAYLCVQFNSVRTIESSLLILGGVSKLFLSQYNQSLIMNTFEIFGCSDESISLPPYPLEVFGPSMIWEGVRMGWTKTKLQIEVPTD